MEKTFPGLHNTFFGSGSQDQFAVGSRRFNAQLGFFIPGHSLKIIALHDVDRHVGAISHHSDGDASFDCVVLRSAAVFFGVDLGDSLSPEDPPLFGLGDRFDLAGDDSDLVRLEVGLGVDG